jgi:hypothetical protein
MSLNVIAMQNVWQYHFCSLLIGRAVGHIGVTEVVRIATLYEFDVKPRFFTTSCDPNIGHTLRRFDTFCLKKETKHGFSEKCLK